MGVQITAVDLFCGAGGLTHGLRQSGIEVVAGFDIDGHCKYAYEHNNPGSEFKNRSVSDLNGAELSELFFPESLSLLSGCAPCQTFSAINPNVDTSDERWWLLLEFGRLIEESLPDFVTMENVPGILKHAVFKRFITILGNNGYKYDYKIIECAQYGMPQRRRRVVLVASKLGEIYFPSSSELNLKPRDVKSAIEGLEELAAGESSKKDPLHAAKGLSDLNIQRIRASRPGGTWKDWDESLRCECHKRETGDSFTAVYGRMEWEKPAPTITTQFYNYGSGRFGHPSQDRALTFREGALLQTFPPSYEFYAKDDPCSTFVLGRLIGNAVPVDLGKIIGDVFVNAANTDLSDLH